MKIIRYKSSAVLSVVLLIGVAVVFFSSFRSDSLKKFEGSGISFDYSASYKQQPLDKTVLDDATRLVILSRVNPPSSINVIKAGSAKAGAAILKISQLDFLEKNAELKFGISYKNYQKQSIERLNISGYDSEIISFSYIGKDGKTTIFMKYIMVVYSDAIYYITVQSIDRLKMEKDSKSIIESIRLSR